MGIAELIQSVMGTGQLGQVVPQPEITADDLYRAISYAETAGEKDPWIRTKITPEGGSTAFGPTQITGTTAQAYADQGLFTPETEEFYNTVMSPMYSQFRKYGREPERKGYDPIYEYGGGGGFQEEHRGAYETMAKEMLLNEWLRTGGNLMDFIEAWRGTTEDERYNQAVRQSLYGTID